MAENKVTNLAHGRKDSTKWTPRQALQEAINDIDSGALNADRLVILAWSTDVDSDRILKTMYVANFNKTEFVARMQTVALDAVLDFKNGK